MRESLKCRNFFFLWSQELFLFQNKRLLFAAQIILGSVPSKAIRCEHCIRLWMAEPTGHKQHTHTLSKNKLPDNYFTMITQIVLGEETYQLQPGVCDQHLVLFILEENERECFAVSRRTCTQICEWNILQVEKKINPACLVNMRWYCERSAMMSNCNPSDSEPVCSLNDNDAPGFLLFMRSCFAILNNAEIINNKANKTEQTCLGNRQ